MEIVNSLERRISNQRKEIKDLKYYISTKGASSTITINNNQKNNKKGRFLEENYFDDNSPKIKENSLYELQGKENYHTDKMQNNDFMRKNKKTTNPNKLEKYEAPLEIYNNSTNFNNNENSILLDIPSKFYIEEEKSEIDEAEKKFQQNQVKKLMNKISALSNSSHEFNEKINNIQKNYASVLDKVNDCLNIGKAFITKKITINLAEIENRDFCPILKENIIVVKDDRIFFYKNFNSEKAELALNNEENIKTIEKIEKKTDDYYEVFFQIDLINEEKVNIREDKEEFILIFVKDHFDFLKWDIVFNTLNDKRNQRVKKGNTIISLDIPMKNQMKKISIAQVLEGAGNIVDLIIEKDEKKKERKSLINKKEEEEIKINSIEAENNNNIINNNNNNNIINNIDNDNDNNNKNINTSKKTNNKKKPHKKTNSSNSIERNFQEEQLDVVEEQKNFPKLNQRMNETAYSFDSKQIKTNPIKYLPKAIKLLKNGFLFLKYGKYGKPHERLIGLNEKMDRIYWKKIEEKKINKFILINNINDIKDGRKTHNFKKFKTKNLDQEICSFSVCSQNRNLDLESKSFENKRKFIKCLDLFVQYFRGDFKENDI